MSEKPWPPEEHTTHIDYFGTNLPTTMLRMNGVLQSVMAEARSQRETAERFDEGICCLEWLLSRLVAHQVVPVFALVQMLGEVVLYANVGRRAPWMERALAEMGKSS
jgi:hypothetical protein